MESRNLYYIEMQLHDCAHNQDFTTRLLAFGKTYGEAVDCATENEKGNDCVELETITVKPIGYGFTSDLIYLPDLPQNQLSAIFLENNY